MARSEPTTLVDALLSLPAGRERGFRFRGLDGKDYFYPWEDLRREATERAARLQALGLKKGDRLALVIAEPHEFVLTFLAATVAGVVPVPIYPRASFKARNAYVETVAHIVKAAGARALVTLEATQPVIEEVIASGAELDNLVILEKFLEGDAPGIELPEVTPDDVCFLQFTSGSTSWPKGVVVTHENLIANADAFLGEQGLARTDDDIALAWLPLYHDMGLIGFVLSTIIHDLNTVLLPTESFARRPSMWMQAMQDYGATITFAPNFAYGLATKRTRDRDLQGLDLSKVRVAGCGAEPINPNVMRSFADRFAPAGFDARALMPAYGMAEATLAISFHPRMTPLVTDTVDAAALARGEATPAEPGAPESATLELVSCGVPFPGHDVRIVSDDGEVLPERRVGEIITRGPSVTSRYYDNPEITAETFRDGWLHTGDLGYFAEGRLYVCGRKKDLIIIRGANHYPQDIEWAVSEVPGVRRDNVIAFSVMRDGEEQLIVCAEGNSGDAAELRKTIAAKVAETNGLNVGHVAVVKVGSLPKTSSGKVQRRRTKQLFETGELEEHP
ncbi:MAG: fatty acyl-AMP ligase [Myxococcales bacterium]|jgi:fatty-acyl-CoA synthase